MAKRTIMHGLVIKEIAAVDFPAQSPARSVIMKRAGDISKGIWMTTATKGHQHLINDMDYWAQGSPQQGGSTSYARSEDEDQDHAHPWVRNADGTLTIGESEGHTHDILSQQVFKTAVTKTEGGKDFPSGDYAYTPDMSEPGTWKLRLTSSPGGDPDPAIVGAAVAALGAGYRGQKVELPEADRPKVIASVRAAWKKANPEKDADAMPEVLKSATKEEDIMTAEEKKALDDAKEAVTKANTAIATLTTDLAVAKALAEMTDAQKSHYAKADKAGQEAFLKMDVAGRAAIVDTIEKNAKDANPIVYKAADGSEFRKNDDPRLVSMAKKHDTDAKVHADAIEKAANLEFEKRATADLSHLPGDITKVKVPFLKAIETITDPEAKAGAFAILKAGETALAKGFSTFGKGADGKDSDPGSPASTLQKGAEAFQKSMPAGTTFEKAYAAYLNTAEGRDAYAASIKSKAAA